MTQSDGNREPLLTLTDHQAAVKAISWCPWRTNCLATGGGTADRMIRIWNTQNGHNVFSVDTKSQVSAILWSNEYRELISSHGYVNNELIIWKYPTLDKVAELTGHFLKKYSLKFTLILILFRSHCPYFGYGHESRWVDCGVFGC